MAPGLQMGDGQLHRFLRHPHQLLRHGRQGAEGKHPGGVAVIAVYDGGAVHIDDVPCPEDHRRPRLRSGHARGSLCVPYRRAAQRHGAGSGDVLHHRAHALPRLAPVHQVARMASQPTGRWGPCCSVEPVGSRTTAFSSASFASWGAVRLCILETLTQGTFLI